MINRLLCILIILVFSVPVCGQETIMKKGVIYVVRHAEKDTGNDPRLTARGYLRSQELANILKNKGDKIDRIYVTRYRRSQLTADSIRIRQKADTVHYKVDTNGDGIINALMKHKDKDKRVLIIAHSNTIPVILRRLGITDFPSGDIPDSEYDNLYTIIYKKGKAFLFKSKYGRSSLPGNGTSVRMLQ